MTHREILDKVGPALRKHAGGSAPWLLAEIDRWCEGDFTGEVDPEYPCCFCKRPQTTTRLLLGCSANIAPDGTIVGPKFHTVIPPGWLGSEMTSAPFPLMVCDDCVRAYEALFEEDTISGRKRPSPAEVLAETEKALQAEQVADADTLMAELVRRFGMSFPREVRPGTCTLCKRDRSRVVHGDVAQICRDCLATARESLRSSFNKPKA